LSNTNFQRARLSASPSDVLAVLPSMDRIMINSRWNGALHERMGVVERVTFDGGWALCNGAEHASRIELARVASVVIDRTSIMGGEAYPRADFTEADGSILCSVISFSGLGPFDSALAAFGPGEELPVDDRQRPAPAEDRPEDPGVEAFQRALESGFPVSVHIDRPGFHQSWQGVIDKVNPARGFINVMKPDFHLHLRMGSVAGWQADVSGDMAVLAAMDGAGKPLGLTVRGKAESLLPASLETA
jgi:hypothetical protein